MNPKCAMALGVCNARMMEKYAWMDSVDFSLFDDVDHVSKMEHVKQRNLTRIRKFSYESPPRKIRLTWNQHKEGFKQKLSLHVRLPSGEWKPIGVFGEGNDRKEAKQDAAQRMYQKLRFQQAFELDYSEDGDFVVDDGDDQDEAQIENDPMSVLEELAGSLVLVDKPNYVTKHEKLNPFANYSNLDSMSFVTTCTVVLSGNEPLEIYEQGIASKRTESKRIAARNVIKNMKKNHSDLWAMRKFHRCTRSQGQRKAKKHVDTVALLDTEDFEDDESDDDVDGNVSNSTSKKRKPSVRLKCVSYKKNAKSVLAELFQYGLLVAMPLYGRKEEPVKTEMDGETQKYFARNWEASCSVTLTAGNVNIKKVGHASKLNDAKTCAAEHVLECIKKKHCSFQMKEKLDYLENLDVELNLEDSENEHVNNQENGDGSMNSDAKKKMLNQMQIKEKNARQILEEFGNVQNPPILQGKPSYDPIHKTDRYGKSFWRAICTVTVVSFEGGRQLIRWYGDSTRKGDAMNSAAEKVLSEILQSHYTDAVKRRIEPKDVPKDLLRDLTLDSDPEYEWSSGSDDDDERQHNSVEKILSLVFDSSKDVFTLLDSYPVTVAKSSDVAEEWIQKNVLSVGKYAEIGVFMEIAGIDTMLCGSTTSAPEGVRENDGVMAIATASGVLLCVGDRDSEWPMPAVRAVLDDKSRNISTVFSNGANMLDIRQRAKVAGFSQVEGSVSYSLEKLMEMYLCKSLGDPYEKVNEELDTVHPRANVAVRVSVAILAVYMRIQCIDRVEQKIDKVEQKSQATAISLDLSDQAPIVYGIDCLNI